MTHADLVRRAERWLRQGATIPGYIGGSRKCACRVVLSELVTSQEVPDAIGWMLGGMFSVLVECKVSRADFLADQEKRFRRVPGEGMGRYRYYMTPAGLLKAGELANGWGLVEVGGNRCKVVVVAEQQPEYNLREEMRLMWSALRRVQDAKGKAEEVIS